MRFLRIFGLLLVAGVFLSGSVLWGALQLRLWMAGKSLAADFLYVRRLAHQEAAGYREKCLAENMLEFPTQKDKPQSVVKGFQLRFTDATHYVVEAVCATTARGPFTVKEAVLSLGVSKLGGSGLLVPTPLLSSQTSETTRDLNALVLIGDRWGVREIGFAGGQMTSRMVPAKDWDNAGTDAAMATCEGWNYRCCDPLSEAGAGQVQDKTTDCRNQCYPVCRKRPILVYFSSDPPLEAGNREISVTGPEVSVRFGFEVMDSDSQIGLVTVDFGDGQKYTAQSTKEIVDHVYRCDKQGCVYTVRITANDTDGLEMMATRLQEILIRQRVR